MELIIIIFGAFMNYLKFPFLPILIGEKIVQQNWYDFLKFFQNHVKFLNILSYLPMKIDVNKFIFCYFIYLHCKKPHEFEEFHQKYGS